MCSEMIRIFIVILAFITSAAQAQTAVDYRLYSIFVRNFIDEGLKYEIHTSKVVIITKFAPTENWASYYGKDFFESDQKTFSSSLRYDTTMIELFKHNHVKAALMRLEQQFYDTPILEEGKFDVGVEVNSMSIRQFDRYFRGISGNRIDNGWKKIYRKYPGSYGVFEFSKIIYEGEFACFYVGRRSGGLSGSGDLIICRRTSNDWVIARVVNIWMS